MTRSRARSARSGQTEHVYDETRYAARSWKQQRRVVMKAEVVRLADREPRDNPRFVVTNLSRPPRSVYEKVYCARGDIENRIKELLDGLQIDRTSLLPVPGEPVPGPVDRRCLRAPAGASAVRRRHRVCPHPGDLAARPPPEAGRPRRPLRPSRRPASAAGNPLPRRVAPHCTRPRSTRRIGPARATRSSPVDTARPHRRSCRCLPFHHPPSPSPDGAASLAAAERTSARRSGAPSRSPLPRFALSRALRARI